MRKLLVTDRSGSERTIEGRVDFSVMENIRDNGFDELLALCGGCCACGTCHVYVDPSFLDALPPMGDDEKDLLDSSMERQPNSRLSCQIRFTDQLDGLKVKIAPEN